MSLGPMRQLMLFLVFSIILLIVKVKGPNKLLKSKLTNFSSLLLNKMQYGFNKNTEKYFDYGKKQFSILLFIKTF